MTDEFVAFLSLAYHALSHSQSPTHWHIANSCAHTHAHTHMRTLSHALKHVHHVTHFAGQETQQEAHSLQWPILQKFIREGSVAQRSAFLLTAQLSLFRFLVFPHFFNEKIVDIAKVN